MLMQYAAPPGPSRPRNDKAVPGPMCELDVQLLISRFKGLADEVLTEVGILITDKTTEEIRCIVRKMSPSLGTIDDKYKTETMKMAVVYALWSISTRIEQCVRESLVAKTLVFLKEAGINLDSLEFLVYSKIVRSIDLLVPASPSGPAVLLPRVGLRPAVLLPRAGLRPAVLLPRAGFRSKMNLLETMSRIVDHLYTNLE